MVCFYYCLNYCKSDGTIMSRNFKKRGNIFLKGGGEIGHLIIFRSFRSPFLVPLKKNRVA